MRKLATIQKILSLNPIPNADSIEVAQILGWKVVVKKGEYTVGELVVYCEIDSLMPEHPCFEFLRKDKFRIRTQIFRGQISQGICFPLSILDSFGVITNDSTFSFGLIDVFVPKKDVKNIILEKYNTNS